LPAATAAFARSLTDGACPKTICKHHDIAKLGRIDVYGVAIAYESDDLLVVSKVRYSVELSA